MPAHVLEVEGVSKSFRVPGGSFSLQDVSLKVRAGQIVVVRGRSGSGKSTLIQIFGLLLSQDAGKISIFGQDVTTFNRRQAADFRSEHIGLVFQSFNLLPQLRAVRNVMVPARVSSKAARGAAEELLRAVHLGDRMQSRPGELSGGEQQRVALARALINNPGLLMADEPTGNLDKENEDLLLRLFREYARGGRGVLIATHSDLVAECADEVVTVDNGILGLDR
jgi:ABC-type lipoprotein export system ATPase subunit